MAWATGIQEDNVGRAGLVAKAAQHISRRSPFATKRQPIDAWTTRADMLEGSAAGSDTQVAPTASPVGSHDVDEDEDDAVIGRVLGEGTPPIVPLRADEREFDLDSIPLEESNLNVLSSLPGLRRQESPDESLCWDEAGEGSTVGDRDAILDEPPRMPKLPFASRLVAGYSESFEEHDWPGEKMEHLENPLEHDRRVFTPRIGVASPRHHDPRTSGRFGTAGSPVHTPRGPGGHLGNHSPGPPRGVLRLEDLERSIQKVDFGRLEARLRLDGCAPPPPPPPSARLTLDGQLHQTPRGGERFSADRELEDNALDANKIPSIFALDSFDEAGDEEELTLVDTSRAVCGGGCRFVKLTNGNDDAPLSHGLPSGTQPGLDDEIAGGLADFLNFADDDALDYILRPMSERGQPSLPLGVATAL